MPPTINEAIDLLCKAVAASLGVPVVRVKVYAREDDGPVLNLPLTPKVYTSEADAWQPDNYQQTILDALEFRALRSDDLVAAIGGDRRRLWKPGGIHELREWGLVGLSKEHGYYRPDAPPEEMVPPDH